MKKILWGLAVGVFIMLFGACGAFGNQPAQMPAPAHTPYSTSPPSPTSESTTLLTVPDISALPVYIPPLDFEPESVWYCESFGYGGTALGYIGIAEDGTEHMRIYMYDAWSVEGELPHFWNGVFNFALCRGYEGDTFYLLDGASKRRFNVLSGTIRVEESEMVLDYLDVELDWTYATEDEGYEPFLSSGEPYVEFSNRSTSEGNYKHYFPTSFIQLADEELGRAMYKMPLFCQEIEDVFNNVPTSEQLFELYNEPIEMEQDSDRPDLYSLLYDNTEIYAQLARTNPEEESYYIWNLCSYSPDTDIEVRTLGVGSRLERVLAALGIGDGREITVPDENEVIYLYDGTIAQCRLERYTGEPLKLWVFDRNIGLVYSFDENNCVFCVEYRDAGY